MKISVIIPVYNAEKYLNRCLSSVRDQNYTNWEVIAIDDGSVDDGYSILLKYASLDKRFKVFRQENQGPGVTRNKAISVVTGDYIVFLDSDDYIDSQYFIDLVECVRAHNSDVIFIDLLQESPDGKIIKPETMSKYKSSSKDKIIRHQMTGKLPWGGCRKAVKTKIIMENNIRYSKDVVGEEALFSFRILYHADKINFIDKPYYHYVNYPNSQSTKGDDDPYGPICKNIEKHLKEIGEFDKYRDAICSFSYTAFILNIFKVTQNYSFIQAYKLSKLALKKFKQNYDFNLDFDSLEIRTRCVLPFARLGMVLPIIIAAKIKTRLCR
jgi:glycosyltransferase involved in cell wall biosynthesis